MGNTPVIDVDLDLGDVAGKFGFGSEEERGRSLLSHFEAT